MKNKILAILPRIPDSETNNADKRFLALIKILSEKYEIHLMYSQSLNENKNTVKLLSECGVKLFSFKKLLAKSYQGIKAEFSNVTKKENYKFILLDSCYSAKYYIPFLGLNNLKCIIVISMDKSQYANKIKLRKNNLDSVSKAILVKEMEAYKMKEMGIYNYADGVILNNAAVAKDISLDIPKVKISVIPDLCGSINNAENTNESVVNAFSEICKKEDKYIYDVSVDIVVIKTCNNENYKKSLSRINDTVSPIFKNIKIMPEEYCKEKSLVQMYCSALSKIKSEYGLVLVNKSIITENSLKALLVCAKAHPEYGIIVPSSNFSINCRVMPGDLISFEGKHFAANFVNWDELKQINGYSFLIKKEVLDSAGNVDEKYSNIRYALFDLCMKSYLAGYKTISASEAFVYCDKLKIDAEENDEKDYKLLFNKWCNLSAGFLNRQAD